MYNEAKHCLLNKHKYEFAQTLQIHDYIQDHCLAVLDDSIAAPSYGVSCSDNDFSNVDPCIRQDFRYEIPEHGLEHARCLQRTENIMELMISINEIMYGFDILKTK
jgi:hypothetical protein